MPHVRPRGAAMTRPMVHNYKKAIRKLYVPVGLDRFDSNYTGPVGSEVFVVSSWGRFRGLESVERFPDGKPKHWGSCWPSSLRPIRARSMSYIGLARKTRGARAC